MKTKNLLTLLAIAGIMVFASCKKDDNNDDPKFSPLTVEENKAALEDEGIAMLNNIKELEALPTIDAAMNMMNYVNMANLFENNPNRPTKSSLINELMKPVMLTASLNDFNAKRVANDLKVQLQPETLVEAWDAIKGTYTWNSATDRWNWTTGNDLIIKFPSTETGTTNNVEFKVYDFLYETGPFAWAGDMTGELPKQIKSYLKVDGASILIYNLNIAYSGADKRPISITTYLELSPFKFAFEASNVNNTSASVSFKWTKSATTLVAFSLSATGDWTESNLSQEELQPGDVISKGNASFQIMNIKVIGDVNVKGLTNEMNGISTSLPEKQRVEKECEIIAKYASLFVCYADNNLAIAKVIPYAYLKEDAYESYWMVNMKFQFADNSLVDMDTYFGDKNAFSELKTAIEDYLNELETKYDI